MPEATDGAAETDRADLPAPGRARLAVALAGVGAAAAQVLLIRELLVASAGNELSIAAVLASWLLWSAVGAWVGGRVVSGSRRPILHITAIALVEVVLFGVVLALSRAALFWLRGLFAGALADWDLVPLAGGTLSLPQLLLLSTLVTGPAGLVLGWQFAAGCLLLEASGAGAQRGSALAYVFDSFGHLVGGAALSIAAVTRLPAEGTLLAACALLLGGVWLLRPVAWRLAVGMAVFVALAAGAPWFRQATLQLRWAPHRLALSQDGPLGNVTILEGEGGGLDFFENGAHAFETGEGLVGEQWVHIPLLAHPSPEQVLLVGGGPRVLREVLKHRPQHVAYFELDPTLIEVVRRRAPASFREALDDPRVTVSVRDARLAGLQGAGEGLDVVLVALSDPTTAQVNRYYTLEWFEQVQQALGPGGVLAFQVMSSGDYLSPELRSYNACLFRTAQESGFQPAVFPGTHMTVLCSAEGTPGLLFDDALALEARMTSRGLDALTILASFYDALDPFRREDRLAELERTTDVRLNRDFAPTCYYYAQVLWASWWRGKTADVLKAAERLTVEPILLAVFGISLAIALLARLSRKPMGIAAPYAVFVAGGSGMTLEVVLLMGLQSLYGYVYGVVGFVVGVLMAALAAGAWLTANRVTARTARKALALTQAGIVLAAGLSVGGLIVLSRVSGAQTAAGVLPIAVISVLMGATGLAVGAAFPAALAATEDGQGTVSRGTALYATDLLGACGGALVAGLILVPLLGVSATCGAVAALGACAALLTITTPIKGEAS